MTELEKFLINVDLLVEGEISRSSLLNQKLTISRTEYNELHECVDQGAAEEIDDARATTGENDDDSSEEFDEVVFNL